jgi:hypothetical protein
VCQRGTIKPARPGTHLLLEVPEGKRFIVTSYKSRFGGAQGDGRLVSLSNGTPSEITPGLDGTWSSGFVFPAGSDVGMKVENEILPPEIDYFLNGYFVAE